VPLMPLRFISAWPRSVSAFSSPNSRSPRSKYRSCPKALQATSGPASEEETGGLGLCAAERWPRAGARSRQASIMNSQQRPGILAARRCGLSAILPSRRSVPRADFRKDAAMTLRPPPLHSGGLERGVDDVDMLLMNEGLCRDRASSFFSTTAGRKDARLPRPEGGRACAPSGRKRRSDQVARDTPRRRFLPGNFFGPFLVACFWEIPRRISARSAARDRLRRNCGSVP